MFPGLPIEEKDVGTWAHEHVFYFSRRHHVLVHTIQK